MNKINRVLCMLIAMVVIMIGAVGVDKVIKIKQEKKWEAEREAYFEKARADIADQQAKIKTLSKDPDALLAFIEENELNLVETSAFEQTEEDVPDNSTMKTVSENTVSGNDVLEDTVSANQFFESAESVEENDEDSVSGNSVSGNSVSGNTVSGNLVSGNGILPATVSGNSGRVKTVCASYAETIRKNQQDQKLLKNSTIDFSDKKIACLGDSITEATNLDEMEDYQKYSYPSRLAEALSAKEVVNLGIGGSSIGRYWDNAFVDRYQKIPEDADIILVMGGTNDGFCATATELGSLEEKAERTFAGDYDELIRGLKENYPEAEIVLITPLPNVLHDLLRKERSELLPQSAFVEMIQELAKEYELPLIDLYHANFLDTHDAAVIHALMPDGVHGNPTGYKMLAEHIGAELIRIEEEKAAQEEQMEKADEGDGLSGNIG